MLHDLFSFFAGRLARLGGFNQFNCLHAAQSTDVSDHRPASLPFLRSLLKSASDVVSAGEQLLVFEHIEHCERGGARERIAGKCAAQTARAGSVHYFGAPGDSRQWQASAQRLRGNDDVRFDSVVFAGE